MPCITYKLHYVVVIVNQNTTCGIFGIKLRLIDFSKQRLRILDVRKMTALAVAWVALLFGHPRVLLWPRCPKSPFTPDPLSIFDEGRRHKPDSAQHLAPEIVGVRMARVPDPRHDHRVDLIPSYQSAMVLRRHAPHLPLHPVDAVFSKRPVRRPNPIAKEVQGAPTVTYGENLRFGVGAEAKLGPEEVLDRAADLMQVELVVVNDHKIIHVSRIPRLTQRVFNEVVQLVQVDVGKHLGRQIANWDATRGQCVVVRRAVNYAVDQPEGFLACDLFPDHALERIVTDRGKIFRNVSLERIDRTMLALYLADVPLDRIDTLVGTLAFPAGEALVDELRLEYRLNYDR